MSKLESRRVIGTLQTDKGEVSLIACLQTRPFDTRKSILSTVTVNRREADSSWFTHLMYEDYYGTVKETKPPKRTSLKINTQHNEAMTLFGDHLARAIHHYQMLYGDKFVPVLSN